MQAISEPWWISSSSSCRTNAARLLCPYGPASSPIGSASASGSAAATCARNSAYARSSWSVAAPAVPGSPSRFSAPVGVTASQVALRSAASRSMTWHSRHAMVVSGAGRSGIGARFTW